MSNHIQRGRLYNGDANPIDVHVGTVLKQMRISKNLSQEQLGEAVGLSFQQIQKYEHGMNRIGASRLYDISCVLNVPINAFFAGINEQTADQSPRFLAHAPEIPLEDENIPTDSQSQKEMIELIKAFYAIPDRTVAKKILELMKSLKE